MLESALKEQLKGIFAGLEANFAFDISVSSSHENRAELLELWEMWQTVPIISLIR